MQRVRSGCHKFRQLSAICSVVLDQMVCKEKTALTVTTRYSLIYIATLTTRPGWMPRSAARAAGMMGAKSSI